MCALILEFGESCPKFPDHQSTGKAHKESYGGSTKGQSYPVAYGVHVNVSAYRTPTVIWSQGRWRAVCEP